MKWRFASSRFARWGVAACLISPLLASAAQLFGDDEARKAILELRERVELNRRTQETLLQTVVKDVAKDLAKTNQTVETNQSVAARGLLDTAAQIDALRAELARLTGQQEQLAQQVAELTRLQKEFQLAMDARLRVFEPLQLSFEGQTLQVKPEEKTDFELGIEQIKQSKLDESAKTFANFLRRYPNSAYQPWVWYWLGNIQYAQGVFKEAIASYQRLIALAPDHVRVSEARLAVANCYIELKDAKSAKKALEDLVRLHPQSEAAVTAKDRLAKLK